MHFSSFQDFLHMGGYAAYVWSAYGIVFITLLIVLIKPIFEKNRILKKLATTSCRSSAYEVEADSRCV